MLWFEEPLCGRDAVADRKTQMEKAVLDGRHTRRKRPSQMERPAKMERPVRTGKQSALKRRGEFQEWSTVKFRERRQGSERGDKVPTKEMKFRLKRCGL